MIHDTKSLLLRGGVDLSRFGTGSFKTLQDLEDEQENRDVVLVLREWPYPSNRPPEVLRVALNVKLIIEIVLPDGTLLRLHETGRRSKNGKLRLNLRPWALSETRKRGEWALEAVKRGIDEEFPKRLGIPFLGDHEFSLLSIRDVWQYYEPRMRLPQTRIRTMQDENPATLRELLENFEQYPIADVPQHMVHEIYDEHLSSVYPLTSCVISQWFRWRMWPEFFRKSGYTFHEPTGQVYSRWYRSGSLPPHLQ